MSAETGGRNPVRRPNFRVSSAHFTYFWRLTRGYVGGASPGVKTYQNQGLGGGARRNRTDDLFNAIVRDRAFPLFSTNCRCLPKAFDFFHFCPMIHLQT
jgi:hypothetical protein